MSLIFLNLKCHDKKKTECKDCDNSPESARSTTASNNNEC